MIVVTGTPGTGKTTIARLLAAELGLPFISVNTLIRAKKLHTGMDQGSLVVDMRALARELRGFKGVVEGHVLCDLKLPADRVVVLRASPRSIARRLGPRNYPKQKLQDNIDSEALDYCLIRSIENYGRRKVVQVNTTGLMPQENVRRVLRSISTRKSDRVDWSGYFLSRESF